MSRVQSPSWGSQHPVPASGGLPGCCPSHRHSLTSHGPPPPSPQSSEGRCRVTGMGPVRPPVTAVPRAPQGSLSATFSQTYPSQSPVSDLFQGHRHCPRDATGRAPSAGPPDGPRERAGVRDSPRGRALHAAPALGVRENPPGGCTGDLPAGGGGWGRGVQSVTDDFTAEWAGGRRGCPWRARCFQKLWSE